MPKLPCLLFIVLIANVDLSGQLPNFSFQHYSSENGYPVKESFSVTQDKYGYIWTSQLTSVTRFDGTNFHVYAHDDNDTLSLPYGKVYDIAVGEKDRLFIAYNRGISYYDPAIDGFRKLIPEDSIRS